MYISMKVSKTENLFQTSFQQQKPVYQKTGITIPTSQVESKTRGAHSNRVMHFYDYKISQVMFNKKF